MRLIYMFYPIYFQAFIPLLKSASKADAGEPISCSRAAIINISSDLGSMSENNYGTKYEYRASKVGIQIIMLTRPCNLYPSTPIKINKEPQQVNRLCIVSNAVLRA